MDTAEEAVIVGVKNHLLASRSLDLTGYSHSFVLRCIKRRMGKAGISDYSEYVTRLRKNETETNEFVLALSINVTEFFRDEGVFEAFSTKVIRPILAAKNNIPGGIFRIWSAGCATGQETYTLAICLEEELKRYAGNNNALVSVVGTDLSVSALSKARAGLFTAEQMKGVPDRFRLGYFAKVGDDYQVSEAIRRRVRFLKEDLLKEPSSKYFDAVVCRNVLIYFSRPMHDQVLMNLCKALRLDGYLMLGKTETMMGSPREYFETVDPENRIFRRIK
jgi:chemotaxis methyl-accepting protein methylase